jgi:hypothetical protein
VGYEFWESLEAFRGLGRATGVSWRKWVREVALVMVKKDFRQIQKVEVFI